MGRKKGSKNFGMNKQTNEVRMNVDVKCNKCKHIWKPVDREITYVEDKQWVVRGFTCPKCGTTYYTSVTDNYIRMNQSKIIDLEEKIVKQRKHIESEIECYTKQGRNIPSFILNREENILIKLQKEQTILKGLSINRGKQLKDEYLKIK